MNIQRIFKKEAKPKHKGSPYRLNQDLIDHMKARYHITNDQIGRALDLHGSTVSNNITHRHVSRKAQLAIAHFFLDYAPHDPDLRDGQILLKIDQN